jgi:hypothetical protein
MLHGSKTTQLFGMLYNLWDYSMLKFQISNIGKGPQKQLKELAIYLKEGLSAVSSIKIYGQSCTEIYSLGKVSCN